MSAWDGLSCIIKLAYNKQQTTRRIAPGSPILLSLAPTLRLSPLARKTPAGLADPACWLVVLVVIWASSAWAADDELLAAEDAFSASVSRVDSASFDVTWDIAEGYYMYRSRFAVTADDPAIQLGAPQIPPGKVKTDEFLGDVETYTGQVTITVPLAAGADSPQEVAVNVAGQGCNEPVGVCYPPLTTALSFQRVAADAGVMQSTSTPSAASGETASSGVTGTGLSSSNIQSLSSLNDLLSGSGGDDEFLPAEEAFKVDMVVSEGNRLYVRFDIADGYYLYRDQTDFKISPDSPGAQNVRLESWTFPEGERKEDEFFGETVVYHNGFELNVPLSRASLEKDNITVVAAYQGCADKGICYPPQETRFDLALPMLAANTNVTDLGSPTPALGGDSATTRNLSSTTTTAATGGAAGLERGFWRFVLAAFGVGVLLTFTPCVLPMIPILAGAIAGQGANVSKTRGGILASVYVLGTAVTYFVIGLVAGASGEQLQAYFQTPVAIGIMVLIFVAMALSMFGLYDIQMPSALQSKLQSRSQGLSSGSVGGVFVLGLFSALIVGACVSPLLISVLSVAIVRGDPWLGGVSMFAMALGMGVFLIMIGIGAGSLLPKAGAWMDRVKQAFGVMLLGVAIYLLGTQPLVPVLLLWAVLFIIVGVYLGATQALSNDATGWRYLSKGVGTVLLVWGVVAMLGGFAGKRDVFDPLPDAFKQSLVAASDGGTPGNIVPGHELFTRVSNMEQLEAAFAVARQQGKPLMLDYYADWCVDCKRMEAGTFEDPEINRTLQDEFVLVQVDVTDAKDPDGKALKQRFGVYGPPAILFFDANAVERTDLRLYGFRSPSEFRKILDAV